MTYTRGGLAEWYRNGPLGLEQGFTLARRPSGTGRLTLAVGTSGSLTPRLLGSRIVFADGSGRASVTYGALNAIDRNGRALPVSLGLHGSAILLEVDDSAARYPLTIDPFIQQAGPLTGGGESGAAQFGFSVALSADGQTALVGGPADDGARGAAWVFIRSGSTWSQQGGKLTGSGETGNGRFGASVALSTAGDTALIGGPTDNTQVGAVWVFTRSGQAWNQQGGKLTATGETGAGRLGSAVALSTDGATALAGGPGDDTSKGAAWVFTRSGSTWSQQGTKLTGTGETGAGQLGVAVALAGDGATALVGADADDTNKGAAWVFTRSGATWNQQGSKLTGAGETGPGEFGTGVALAGDGSTALVGGPDDDASKGAAWAFTRSGTTWNAQGVKLTAGGEAGTGEFGYDIALTPDGNLALIGGDADDGLKGALWLFARSASTWSQQGDKLTASGETGAARLGFAVALSSDAKTALSGGFADNGAQGAVWVFTTAAPSISSISPAGGPAAGGTLVTVDGTGFTAASAVKFGSTAATLFKVASDTELSAVAPPGSPGAVDVTVTSPTGTSAATAVDRFTYAGAATTTTATTTPAGGDRQAPTAPASFTGRYSRSVLRLTWHASRDNVRVAHYELYANGAPFKRIAGSAIHASISNLAPQRRTVLNLRAFDAAGNRSGPSRQIAIAPVARPRDVPRTVPSWAPKLFAWETHGRHGKRPATPKKLPAWYAHWKAWQLAPYRVIA